MNITIKPGRLSGKVRAPASKSAAHRALVCAALGDALTTLRVNALNDDLEATIDALTALGAVIDFDPRGERLAVRPIEGAPGLRRRIEGLEGRIAPHVDYGQRLTVDCGESGSTLRFMLPVTLALGARARFAGHGRLPERPNKPLTDALRAHGAVIDADTLPMNAEGPLRGGLWSLPGDVSSQYVTGLLLALPLLPGDSEIRLTTLLASAPYVDMTLAMLRRFGITVEPAAGGWRVPGGQAYRSPGELAVEGDWSAAAFWLAANAFGGDIAVEGLSDDSAQGDRAVARLLGRPEIDASNVPDLVPALAAAAAVLPQRTVITGAARLRLKESDRLQTTAAVINGLGGHAEITADGLVIEGGMPLAGGEVDGANDHRIVMAASILATCCAGPTVIRGAEAVNKSYPAFFEHFRALGGKCDVQPAGR